MSNSISTKSGDRTL